VDDVTRVLLGVAIDGALVRGAAIQDFIARGEARFQGQQPTTVDVQAWAQELRISGTAPHLFTDRPGQAPRPGQPERQETRQDLSWLSPSERLTKARAERPPTPRKHQARPLTPAESAEVQKIASPTGRLTKIRELRAAGPKSA
jgi:hypothetical protein